MTEVALIEQRVTTLERRTEDLVNKTVSKELHTIEFQNVERRINGIEATLKTIVATTVANLLALSGFLAWQVLS